MSNRLHLLLKILQKLWEQYSLTFNPNRVKRSLWNVVFSVRVLLLYFTAEFYNEQMDEIDSSIQFLLKKLLGKFDKCENSTTLAT